MLANIKHMLEHPALLYTVDSENVKAVIKTGREISAKYKV